MAAAAPSLTAIPLASGYNSNDVRAITAEAKWSGMFLSGFPIAALIMINVIRPDYYDDVKDTPAFIPAALIVAVFLIVNVIFMKMMVNIKV